MMKIRILKSIAVFVACFFAITANGQSNEMYQYTDENGTVVFTDQKPVDQEVKTQAIPSDPAPQGDNPYATENMPDVPSIAEQRREEIVQNKQQAQQAQAVNQAQCAAWQAEVDRLEPNRRVFFTNDKGETERMDDVERVNKVAALKQQIAANCK